MENNHNHNNSNNNGSYDYNPVSPQHFSPNACYYWKKHWKNMVVGQVLSLLISSANAAQSTLHLQCHLSAPAFTMSLAYFCLGSFHLLLLVWRQYRYQKQQQQQNTTTNDDPPASFCCGMISLQLPVWKYTMIAFLDVQANALNVLSFRYTTLTSVTLLNALAIPAAMSASQCLFVKGRHYTLRHFLGVTICLIGMVINVMVDYHDDNNNDNDDTTTYPYKLWGDVLALGAGILFGLNDVLTEVTVRNNKDTVEYLGIMGCFAFGFSIVQALVFEWDRVKAFFIATPQVCSVAMEGGLVVGFVIITVTCYVGASRFLLVSEAAFFNLSLLTGDLWSVVFSIVAQHILPPKLFYVALLLVMGGVVLYEMAPSPVVDEILLPQSDNDNNNDIALQEPSDCHSGDNGTNNNNNNLQVSAAEALVVMDNNNNNNNNNNEQDNEEFLELREENRLT